MNITRLSWPFWGKIGITVKLRKLLVNYVYRRVKQKENKGFNSERFIQTFLTGKNTAPVEDIVDETRIGDSQQHPRPAKLDISQGTEELLNDNHEDYQYFDSDFDKLLSLSQKIIPNVYAAHIDLKDETNIDLKDGTNIDLKDGTNIDLEDGTNIDLKDGTNIDLEDGINIDLKNGTNIDLKNGTNIDLKNGTNIELEDGATIDLKNGTNIELEDGTNIDLKNGTNIDLKNGTNIELEDGTEAPSSEFEDAALNRKVNLQYTDSDRFRPDFNPPKGFRLQEGRRSRRARYLSLHKSSVSLQSTIYVNGKIK